MAKNKGGRTKKLGLTAQQSVLVDRYFENGFEKKDALLFAKYSDMTANHGSHIIFGRDAVKAEIERRKAKLAKKHDLSQDWLIEQFMKRVLAPDTLAKFKMIDQWGQLYWDFTGATKAELAMVRDLGVEFTKIGRGKDAIDITKFKMKEPDDQAALMALGRHLGFFNDKLEITGSLEERIQAGRNRACKSNETDSDNIDDPVETLH